MNDFERATLLVYPELHRLIELKATGCWLFQPIYLTGGIELVAGSRAWPGGWSEAIAIRNINDAKAFREHPAGGTVWNREGSLVDVIDAMTDLPPPGACGAPSLVIAQTPSLWTPRQ